MGVEMWTEVLRCDLRFRFTGRFDFETLQLFLVAKKVSDFRAFGCHQRLRIGRECGGEEG
ncbi:hypothetical protein D3C81_2324130 [compost metagenome]